MLRDLPVLDRPVPYDARLEQGILHNLFWEPPMQPVVMAFLEPEHFFLPECGQIYAAMRTLHAAGRPISYLTLAGELDRLGQLDGVGGYAALVPLLERPYGADTQAEDYARTLIKLATKRGLISVGGQIAALGYDQATEAAELCGQAETLLRTVTDRPLDTGFAPLDYAALSAHLDALQARTETPQAKGITTGITELDYVLRWRRGQLIVPAGRPSQGKTALALTFALNAQRAGKTVGLVSLEMDRDEIQDRLLAMAGGANLHSLQMAELDESDWIAVNNGANVLTQQAAPLYLLDLGSMTVPQLRGKALQLQARHGLDLLIVDYLQLLRAVRETPNNRTQDVSAITRALKQLARELRVPVIAPSQLSRAVESRDGQRPRLSDLRESGSIEQDADVVLFIYRPDPTQPGAVDLLIEKHRNGPTGEVGVVWHASTVRFHGLDERHV